MRPTKSAWGGLVLGALSALGLSPRANGQGAIAFVPIPAPAFSGQTMTVTPAVSADRRYVRLSVNAYFNAINGFSNFTTPLGAVGGGGIGGGGGGLGGLGGAGGAGGGGVGGGAGGGNVGGGGLVGLDATLDAGMNGVIGATGIDEGSGFGQAGFVNPFDQPKAGAFAFDEGFADRAAVFVGDGLNAGGPLPNASATPRTDFLPDQSGPPRVTSLSEKNADGGAKNASNATIGPHSSARKSATRPPKGRKPRAARVVESNDVEPIVKPKKPS